MEFRYLFGKDHGDPIHYAIQSLNQHMAIGIASVVTLEQKSHNWSNNENAAEILDILLALKCVRPPNPNADWVNRISS